MRVKHHTLCPHCDEVVPARIWADDGDRIAEIECDQCGETIVEYGSHKASQEALQPSQP